MKAKKILCSVLAGAVAVSALSISAFAEEEKEMSVTVRIEGISENLYYDTVDVPYMGESLTVQDALMYVDEQSDDITITGVESGWITAVNNDVQGSFGGWDGWLYMVNGVSPYDTVDTYKLSDGDSVVLYYGDPYGVGMQYPEIDTSKIDEGILTFISQDTIYDADYNSTVVTNPVVNSEVEWSTENDSVIYTTDENGSIDIDDEYLTEGNHSVSISKVSENGTPLVLRLAPDFTVAVPVKAGESSVEPSQESSNESSIDENSQTESSNETSIESSVNEPTSTATTETPSGKAPSTGDSSALTVIALTATAAFAVILMTRKRYDEK